MANLTAMAQLLRPLQLLCQPKSVNCSRLNTQFIHVRSRIVLLIILASAFSPQPGTSQTPDPGQIIPPIEPTPLPLPTPTPLPPPGELLEPPTTPDLPTQELPDNVPGTIIVERFEFEGNTAFSDEELAEVTQDYVNRPISFAELLQARSAVTKKYIDDGYITSGALIPPQTLTGGVVTIQVVEGSLEDIEITGTEYLNPNYVRSRIALGAQTPLNRKDLLEALQLLQLDPVIETLSAELSAGANPGQNLLQVRVTEAPAFHSQITLDNGRSPSVGTFRRQLEVSHNSLLGQGDRASISYTNTDGSNAWEGNYSIPFNPRNGTLSVNVSNTDSTIIEPPFDVVDIEARSRNYELTVRQPLVRTPRREFALGLTAARRESQTSLLNVPFPLSPGADDEGKTKVSALRFFQEWTQRDENEVLAARSQFSLGVDWFDATSNAEGPDSEFFAWRGQLQWLKLLAPETELLLRSDIQLATEELLPLEQFGLGGQDSVRGYRQDALLTDNGIFASAEVRVPIFRTRNRQIVLQLAPFVDIGTVWNSSGKANPEDSTLVSAGLGLRLRLGDRLQARFDWGLPLVDIESGDRTWQENGFYFSVEARPF